MNKIVLTCIAAMLVALAVIGGGCVKPNSISREGSQQVAEEYVKNGGTFKFDGMPETLKTVSFTSISGGWEFIIEFDSRHAGYGDREGQMLAQVITHHIATIRVEAGIVQSALMDGIWDMMKQDMTGDYEIRAAPIHEVEVYFMESYPVQVGVRIKLGLSDGCTAFHDAVVTKEGNVISIEVTTQRPKDKVCPAIYTYHEENLNLGSDFTQGTTYTLKVNDHTTTFEYY